MSGGRLSEELIAISTMMMVANDRAEMVHLSSELNTVIEKTMELERSSLALPTKKIKSSSTTIKFTEKEINSMSKTFKKEFIANGLVARVIARPSGKNGVYYEIRYRRNGYNITVSHKDLKKAKELFIERTKNLDKISHREPNKILFGDIIDEWLAYKKGKITKQFWTDYASNAKKFIPEEIRQRDIKMIRTRDLENLMPSFSEKPRKYEDLRTLFNSVFKYAIASGVLSHNPVTLIPFKKAERENRDALTADQVKAFLNRLQQPQYDNIRQSAYVLYFFGLRPCELDKEAHFEHGFLVCRNRKRKNGKIEYKKIPVPKQANGLIDFKKSIRFPRSYDRCGDILKEILGDGLTPYNLRHTFASLCSKAVRPDIVEVWMGDSPERLVGKTYVHFPDDFMKEQMETVNFITPD